MVSGLIFDILHVIAGFMVTWLNALDKVVLVSLFVVYQVVEWLIVGDFPHLDLLEFGVGYVLGCLLDIFLELRARLEGRA
jgi:hypothetical protein